MLLGIVHSISKQGFDDKALADTSCMRYDLTGATDAVLNPRVRTNLQTQQSACCIRPL